ncbi:hypothetical protein Ciccas_010141 [Cichlidogyrus casuarinus]|uniref:Uncharacterized protein n=1 Tax=Cichlidogyrus casuarinus TaxID=1844966 RepID=A0ABD2PWW6_9PLAT
MRSPPTKPISNSVATSNKIKKRLTKFTPKVAKKRSVKAERVSSKRQKLDTPVSDTDTDPMNDSTAAEDLLMPAPAIPLTLKITTSSWRRPSEEIKPSPVCGPASDEDEEASSSSASSACAPPAVTPKQEPLPPGISTSSASLSSQPEKHSMRNRPAVPAPQATPSSVFASPAEMPTLTYTKPAPPPLLPLSNPPEVAPSTPVVEPRVEEPAPSSSGIKIKIKFGPSSDDPSTPLDAPKMPKL